MVAAEAVERGRTSTADVLAFAAMDGAEHGGDESVMRVLSRFAMDGKFVGDLSLSEQELLEAAVAAQEQERSTRSSRRRLSAIARGYHADEDGNGRGDGCPDCP